MATKSGHRPALCLEYRANPCNFHLDPSRQSNLADPENSPGYADAAALTSLRGPSLESPQGYETSFFATAASTNPRAFLS